MKRRRNRNWGQPFVQPSPSTVPEFERVACELKLEPDQYLGSERLREWAKLNRHSKYVPESLLAAWGFDVATRWDEISSMLYDHSDNTDDKRTKTHRW